MKIPMIHVILTKSLRNCHAPSIKGLLDSIFNVQRNQFENSNSG